PSYSSVHHFCLYYSPYAALASSTFFLFLTAPATTEIYTLSLHDALPISARIVSAVFGLKAAGVGLAQHLDGLKGFCARAAQKPLDRKSTRLNSSHGSISYAVFCLKKKKENTYIDCRSSDNTVSDRRLYAW